MNICDCCGCSFSSDYGTSVITGEGVAGDEFVVSMVDPAWVRPAARVRRTTDQLIPNNTFEPISFDSEIFDTGNFWAIGAPTLFTITEPGIYIIGGNIKWGVNATGTRELGIRKNGSTILNLTDQPVDSANGGTFSPWSTVTYNARLSFGDTLELVARHESGVLLNTFTEADDTHVFWIVYAGRTV